MTFTTFIVIIVKLSNTIINMKEKEWLFAQDQFLKKIADWERLKRWWSQEKLGELVWKKQTAIQPYLTWTRIPKDLNIYKEIFKVFWFTEKQINNIFLQARKEQIKAEFWEELLSSKEFSFDELLEMMKEKEWLTEEEMTFIKNYIKVQKMK